MIDARLQQRYDALRTANEIRTRRRIIKEEIASRERLASEVVANAGRNRHLDTMKVADLLRAVPGLGDVKITRMMRELRMTPRATFGNVRSANRAGLVDALRRWEARQPRLDDARRKAARG